VSDIDFLSIPVPHAGPMLFMLALAVHVPAGVTCVVSGAVAARSGKSSVRHVLFGRVYFWALCAVFATMAFMSLIRWPDNASLFVIGCVALGAGSVGYLNRRHKADDTVHIIAMGVSYIALLTGFYVDDGRHLPLWNAFPVWSYWLLPSQVGLPSS
jgi:hypothetical protein